MLILQRRSGDLPIYISVPPSTETTVIAVKIADDTISKSRIGFMAPPNVEIVRGELLSEDDAELVYIASRSGRDV